MPSVAEQGLEHANSVHPLAPAAASRPVTIPNLGCRLIAIVLSLPDRLGCHAGLKSHRACPEPHYSGSLCLRDTIPRSDEMFWSTQTGNRAVSQTALLPLLSRLSPHRNCLRLLALQLPTTTADYSVVVHVIHQPEISHYDIARR
eukprot:IDg2459t1